ncbi:protein tyrosine phosphatase [Enterovirga sp.]|uniref:tyrosine phosphatase family protein n=1 Tax=Enterovirga sp. TaxID=2026350 RepID=UPI00262A3F13|nr:protein tyrosine phosphatase [Enterovirga sp.]MDB5589765.1 hypothetical protein [Enterovirga sp.]
MRLLVGPLGLLPGFVPERPSHLVTVASRDRPVPAAPWAAAQLHLTFHDITAPTPGLCAPGRDDVEALLALGRSWTGERPLAVLCEFGISRSPAIAFILACQARPDLAPDAIARGLRAAAPESTPNRLLIGLADAALGRDGAMVAAAAAIGRGAEYSGPASFRLDL